ncbi:MAG: TrkA C-terminal domain-containing protein [Fibrobacterota bacterium]
MVPLISLLLIIIITLLVNRVASVALTMTGLPKDISRFQSRSAFTGVGFTTEESEKMMRHPARRRIIMTLMLLGSIGLISVIASVIRLEATIGFPFGIVILVTGVVLVSILASSRTLDRWLFKVSSLILRRITALDVHNFTRLIRVTGTYEITEIKVGPDSWFIKKTLNELALRKEGIEVLGIHRKRGAYIGAPRSSIRVEEGDILVLYGYRSSLWKVKDRPEGEEGDRLHREASEEAQKRQEKEIRKDKSRKVRSRKKH